MATGDRRVFRMAGDPPLDFAVVELDDGKFALATVPVPVSGDTAVNQTVVLQAPITASPLQKASANFTRPNNATQYAAQDEVSNSTVQGTAAALTFANVVAANGDTGYIVKAKLKITGIAATASPTNGVFRLWLFNAAPTMVGDNAAWPLLDADAAKDNDYIDFAVITEGTGSTVLYALDDGLRLGFKCAAGSRNLYGLLLAKAAYTPTALSVWTVDLMAELA